MLATARATALMRAVDDPNAYGQLSGRNGGTATAGVHIGLFRSGALPHLDVVYRAFFHRIRGYSLIVWEKALMLKKNKRFYQLKLTINSHFIYKTYT